MCERGCMIWSNNMFREEHYSSSDAMSLRQSLFQSTYILSIGNFIYLYSAYILCTFLSSNSEIAIFACSLTKVDSSCFFWFHRNFLPWTVYHNCFSGRKFMWNQMNQSLILVPSLISNPLFFCFVCSACNPVLFLPWILYRLCRGLCSWNEWRWFIYWKI